MKAWGINRFGGPEVFQELEVPTPTLGDSDVLIQVKASSFNPIDAKIRRGELPVAPKMPAILHGDVAGIVVQTGRLVQRFQIGDEVYGMIGGFGSAQGALADYIKADSSLLARKPNNLSFQEAAVLPIAAITVWEALVEKAPVRPGQRVLIHGGTGGVGHIAVQMAKALGATVDTTCGSREKMELARSLGADEGINYRETSVNDYVQNLTGGDGYDIVFDTSGLALEACFQAAASHGHVLAIGARSSYNLTPAFVRGLSIHMVMILQEFFAGRNLERYGRILEEIRIFVEEGHIKPLLNPQQFSFHEVSAAHRYAEQGIGHGKISLSHDNASNDAMDAK